MKNLLILTLALIFSATVTAQNQTRKERKNSETQKLMEKIFDVGLSLRGFIIDTPVKDSTSITVDSTVINITGFETGDLYFHLSGENLKDPNRIAIKDNNNGLRVAWDVEIGYGYISYGYEKKPQCLFKKNEKGWQLILLKGKFKKQDLNEFLELLEEVKQ